jgi:hypothetical protein
MPSDICPGDEADNRKHQEHQHAGEPMADEPEVEQGNGQQQADGDVHGPCYSSTRTICRLSIDQDRKRLRKLCPRSKAPETGATLPVMVRAGPTRRHGDTRPDNANDYRKPAPKKAEVPPKSVEPSAKAAIVSIRKRQSGEAPDLTPEEHQRRGDAAEALFSGMKRKIAATKPEPSLEIKAFFKRMMRRRGDVT